MFNKEEKINSNDEKIFIDIVDKYKKLLEEDVKKYNISIDFDYTDFVEQMKKGALQASITINVSANKQTQTITFIFFNYSIKNLILKKAISIVVDFIANINEISAKGKTQSIEPEYTNMPLIEGFIKKGDKEISPLTIENAIADESFLSTVFAILLNEFWHFAFTISSSIVDYTLKKKNI